MSLFDRNHGRRICGKRMSKMKGLSVPLAVTRTCNLPTFRSRIPKSEEIEVIVRNLNILSAKADIHSTCVYRLCVELMLGKTL
jgi:hypothetical protein